MKVIYPYLANYSRELEWSIKSLKYTPYDDVIVITDNRPDYEVNASYLKPMRNVRSGFSPYNDVINKLYSFTHSSDEDFLLMNDDIFLLADYDGTIYDRGNLEDHVNARRADSYTTTLSNTSKWLKFNNLPTKDYETHTPMVMNGLKLKKLIEKIEPQLMVGHNLNIRSLYGNMYDVQSETISEDTKNPINYKDKAILSTTEQSFLGGIGHYIRSVLSGVSDEEPKYSVSVVIPAYNAADTILKCLESIPDHEAIKEIIVCDDGSTDNTVKVIKKYIKTSKRDITLLENVQNRSVGYTFNKLIDASTMDYVLRIDSDDYFTEEITTVLDILDGSDIIYFNMTDNEGYRHDLSDNNKHLTVACCHLYKRDFIGDTRTNISNWGEDAKLFHALMAKNPTEFFTHVDAYHYNFPRAESLTGIRKSRKRGEFTVEQPRLNIFTNCHNGCLEDPTIFKTYESYVATFGKPEKLTIYCDPNPNWVLYYDYAKMIEEYFGQKPIQTNGLADGYIQSVKNADTEYIFQLEADWEFQNVNHSLDDILFNLKKDQHIFLLFNQHQNIPIQWLERYQTYFKQSSNKMFCLSDRVSNNPHMIDAKTYENRIAPMVDWSVKGAGYIEQALEKKFDIAVYGEYGLQPTIKHMDMRRGGLK